MPRQLSADEKSKLWEQVQAEFPDDEAMQEVHYVRLLHHYKTEGMDPAARLRFYGTPKRKSRTAA